MGVLSVGTVPMVALATEAADGIEVMFADPEGAFSNAKVVTASFDHLGSRYGVNDYDGDGVYTTTFQKNKPVVLNEFTVEMVGGAEAGKTFTIPSNDSDYKIEYFTRNAEGKPSGDAITTDISAVGKYIVKITAVGGHYEGGVVYLPFDIEARQLGDIVVDGNNYVTYNAEAHEFGFFIDNDGNGYYNRGDEKLYEGTDYTVYYVPEGTDATEASKTDVKNVGTYRAVVTGMGDYAGTVEVSQKIEVSQLNLSYAPIEGIVTTSASKPESPFYIWIDGVRYDSSDAIMSELKATLVTDPNGDGIWKGNGTYGYTVEAANPSENNITGSKSFNASKVGIEASFRYDGKALPESVDIYKNDSKTAWNDSAVTGFAADGTMDGLTIPSASITKTVYNVNGGNVTGTNWQDITGSYTIVIKYVAADRSVGGIATVNANVYEEKVDADASAAVLFDVNSDGEKEIVTSVDKTYDGFNTIGQIDVVVEDANGSPLTEGVHYDVTYYNADGKEVGDVTNAGTYTLKVTSREYKLSGTTEMTVNVAKLDMSGAKVTALDEEKWDKIGTKTVYLPWQPDGVTLDELGLAIVDEDGNQSPLPMNMVKATILDANGNELNVIDDEGVYTIHFEARNADAENNYVIPSDLTITCIKDGTYVDADGNRVDHLKFTDVKWSDYFIDSVTWVSGKGIMTGYSGTRVFGALDNITRADVVGTLYKMAGGDEGVWVSDGLYDALVGWKSFDDVDGTQYYGRSIAWAKAEGVVNGHDGKFRPEDTITREEFAAMLANYADKYGVYEEADASVLDTIDGGSDVSAWATGSVAWAVENGIMGNGGFVDPQSEIIRADVAGMIYNFAK